MKRYSFVISAYKSDKILLKAMKKDINLKKADDMKILKFLLAGLAGFGLVKLFGYITDAEFDEDGDFDMHDDDEYPLFV